jgi:integrase
LRNFVAACATLNYVGCASRPVIADGIFGARERERVIHFEPTTTIKSSGKDIDIPITADIASVLARARKLVRIDPGLGGDAYVIQTSTGTPYSASGIRGAIGFAAERAGLAPPRVPSQQKPNASGFTAKDLRAYASSSASRQGYSLEKLKTALAHTTIATTEGYVQQHTTPVSEVVLHIPKRPNSMA